MRLIALGLLVLLLLLICSGVGYGLLQLWRTPSIPQSSSYDVISVEIKLPDPVTKISCGPGFMIVEHGSPGQPGYTKRVHYDRNP